MECMHKTVFRLRAHHIYCVPFLRLDAPERGAKYREIKGRIRQAMREEQQGTIEIIEGVDELCLACPLGALGRCESPNGNEEEVRKWDALVLKGLGLSPGSVVSVQRLRELARDKPTIPLCRRCRWRGSCERVSG